MRFDLPPLIFDRRLMLVGLLVLSGLAAHSVARLEFQESTRDVLYSSPRTSALLDELEQSFGSDENDCYVVLIGDPIFSPEGLAVLRRFVAAASRIDGVASIHSLLDVRREGRIRLPLIPAAGASASLVERRRQEALQHRLVREHLLSPDAKATLVAVRLQGSRLSVVEMLRVVDPLRSLLREATSGTSVEGVVTGFAAINTEIVRSVKWAMIWFAASASLICFAIGITVFRSLSAAVVTYLAPLVGCLWAIGLLAAMGVQFNIVQSIMPTLVVATGFSDAVHLMYQLREKLREGVPKARAVRATVTRLGPACALTSMTTAIGFGSLMLSGLPAVRMFGLACALGCALTFVSVIVTFIALTQFFHFQWENQSCAAAPRARWPERAYALIARRPVSIAVVAALGVTAMAPLFFRLRPDYQYRSSLPIGGEAVRALACCDQLFGGSFLVQVLVNWDQQQDPAELLRAVQQVHTLIEDQAQLSAPISVLTLLRALSRDAELGDDWSRLDRLPQAPVRRLIHKDDRRLLVHARIADRGSRANAVVLERLRAGLEDVDSRYPGAELNLTGIAPMAFESVNQIIHDLSGCLAVASGVIFAVLASAFRSLRLGLIAVIPNAFPVVSLAAILAVSGLPLTYTSVLVFTIALGIAVDDTIHFIFRYQFQRRAGRSVNDAVRLAYSHVGPAMVTTTLIFTAAFASLRISDIPQHHSLAYLCATSMVLALVGDLVILPALLLSGARVRERG